MFVLLVLASATSPLEADSTVPFEHVIIDSSQIAYQRLVIDLDGDGMNDIVGITTNHIRWWRAPNFVGSNILQLSVAVNGFNEFRADDFKAADIDGDGDPDLVLRIGDSGNVNGNTVWFENPRPALPVTATWPMHVIGSNIYVKDIAVDDFDNDGKLDVVTRTHPATQIWFQNSASNWVKKEMTHALNEGMNIGDLDNDGDPDIVLNGFWLQTLSNPRTGTYLSHVIDTKWFNQSGGWQINSCRVVVADIDGNGKLDVLLSHSELPGYPVSWYSATNPTGLWTEHIVVAQCDYCHNLRAADFNDDGILDVLAGGMPQSQQSGLALYLGNANGTWSVEVIQSLGSYTAVIGDLQDDGDIDVTTIRNWNQAPTEIWENTFRDNVQICAGDIVASATFQPPPDGKVDGADLAFLLGAWGSNAGSPADIVTSETFTAPPDGKVDGADLAVLLGAWGVCN